VPTRSFFFCPASRCLSWVPPNCELGFFCESRFDVKSQCFHGLFLAKNSELRIDHVIDVLMMYRVGPYNCENTFHDKDCNVSQPFGCCDWKRCPMRPADNSYSRKTAWRAITRRRRWRFEDTRCISAVRMRNWTQLQRLTGHQDNYLRHAQVTHRYRALDNSGALDRRTSCLCEFRDNVLY
jgi:hypothetical protein